MNGQTRTSARWAGASLLLAIVVAAGALAFVAVRGSHGPITFAQRVDSIAGELRCTVCRDLSVRDSPAPFARQMRAQIARDLRAGLTHEQVLRRFVAAYGEWILLSPPTRGLSLLAWVVPPLLVTTAFGLAGLAVRRWRRRGIRLEGEGGGDDPGLSLEERGLLERELQRGAAE